MGRTIALSAISSRRIERFPSQILDPGESNKTTGLQNIEGYKEFFLKLHVIELEETAEKVIENREDLWAKVKSWTKP